MPVRQMTKYHCPNFEIEENKIEGSLKIQSRKVLVFSKFTALKEIEDAHFFAEINCHKTLSVPKY